MPITIVHCPICSNEFDSGGNIQRVYCTPRCRAKAAKLKEKGKYNVARVTETKPEFRFVTDPTIDSLDAYAKLALLKALPEPVFFVGNVPEWQPPAGVDWMKLEATGDIPERWGLC